MSEKKQDPGTILEAVVEACRTPPEAYAKREREELQAGAAIWIEAALIPGVVACLADLAAVASEPESAARNQRMCAVLLQHAGQGSVFRRVGTFEEVLQEAQRPERRFQDCKFCRNSFEISTAQTGFRSHREFCSDSCKTKDYRWRRRTALGLLAEGQPITKVAKQVGTAVQTVRNWKQKQVTKYHQGGKE